MSVDTCRRSIGSQQRRRKPCETEALRSLDELVSPGWPPHTSSVAIARTVWPSRCRSAITTRSSSDKYRDEIDGFDVLITGG